MTKSKDIGKIDGWQITQPADGVLEARTDSGGYIKVTGNPKDDPQALRARLFAAMAETDASDQAQAKSRAAGQDATLVVTEAKE